MSRSYAYPARALAADYARSAAGLGVCAGPIAFLQPAPVVCVVLAAAATLFLVYFVQTVCRHLTHIELDEAGISTRGPLGAEIRWERLRSVRLDYFSTRGDREEGWMQLKLRGPRRSIRIDSELEGFAELARVAASQARRRGCSLDEATRRNLLALGAGD